MIEFCPDRVLTCYNCPKENCDHKTTTMEKCSLCSRDSIFLIENKYPVCLYHKKTFELTSSYTIDVLNGIIIDSFRNYKKENEE